MEIETYEVEELTTEGRMPEEIEAQALQLIEELGLQGQRERVHKTSEEDPGTRNPYGRMTERERLVYSTICPKSTPVEEYDAGPIPLRVLQVIAHARPLFHELEVWHEAEDPDPVLVGVNLRPGSTWQKLYHLLARWGTELEPFEKLEKKARERKEREWKNHISSKEQECKVFAAGLQTQLDKYFAGTYVSVP